MNKIMAAMAFLTVVATGSSAWATAVPFNVPEPGTFGIVAGGALALLLAAGLRRKK